MAPLEGKRSARCKQPQETSAGASGFPRLRHSEEAPLNAPPGTHPCPWQGRRCCWEMPGTDSKSIFPAGHPERETVLGDGPVPALGATAWQAVVDRLLLSQDAAADDATGRYGSTGGGTAARSPPAALWCPHDNQSVRGRSCPRDAVPLGGRSVTSAQGDAGRSVCLTLERDGDVKVGQTWGVQKPQQSPEHAVPPA